MDTETALRSPLVKADIILENHVTPQMIRDLREELGQSLTEFGLTLRRAIDPKIGYPYTRQYVSALEHGRERITEELIAAFYNIATKMDEVPAGTGGAVAVNVIAQPGQVIEGAFIPRAAKTVRCQRPGCAVQFIKTHPSQKYHDPECK